MARDDDDRRDDDRREKKTDPTEVKLERVRLSFEHIFKAKAFEGNDNSDPKFNASFIIDPDTPEGKRTIDACWKGIDEAMFKEWGNKPPKLSDSKYALRDDKGGDEAPEYDGKWYVSASNSKRPKVFDRDGRTPLTAEDGVIYSGCYVNAIVRFWAQDNKFGKRVNASLEGVQFVKDGEAFGAPGISDDAFDPVEGEDDDRGRSRGGRDRDGGRDARGRDRDRGDDDRGGRRIRDRDDNGRDRERGGGRNREDDDRGRGRDRDDDRGRDRDEGRDRGRDRDRDDDRGRDRDDDRGRDRGRDDDRGGGRDRDRDSDRGSSRRGRDLV